jgi:hypothetical protein
MATLFVVRAARRILARQAVKEQGEKGENGKISEMIVKLFSPLPDVLVNQP